MPKEGPLRVYSKQASDTFSVFISLPPEYDSTKKYPVVYLLDANLYFDIMAAILKKYTYVNLAPEVILVGVGYRDILDMDSLRDRDYTFPKALPEYEMGESGHADQLLGFFQHELQPLIAKKFGVDTNSQTIMGHSLGGYFVTYAFYQQMLGHAVPFRNFIAASPSVDYNKHWLLDQMKAVKPGAKHTDKRLFVTFGGAEEEDEEALSLNEMENWFKSFKKQESGRYQISYEVLSGLNHMDTQFPSFIKGLRTAYPME